MVQRPTKCLHHYLGGVGNAFTQKLGEKRNHEYLLTDFNAIRKRLKEDTLEFIKIFNKKYNNLPVDIKPPLVVVRVVLLGSLSPTLVLP